MFRIVNKGKENCMLNLRFLSVLQCKWKVPPDLQDVLHHQQSDTNKPWLSKEFVNTKGDGRYSSDEVVAIILDYNKPQLTNLCLLTLFSFNDVKVIVVNNGSARREQYATGIPYELICNPKGRSFSSGMNEGASTALKMSPNYLIFLNNDALVTKDAIRLLIRVFHKDSRLAMVGPNSQYSAKKGLKMISSISNTIQSFTSVSTEPIVKRKEKLTGFCLCVRANVFQEIGGFDESFVFGREDDDLSLRIIKRNYSIAEVENAVVYHTPNTSTDFGSSDEMFFLIYNMARGSGLIAQKYGMNLGYNMFLELMSSTRTILKALLLGKKFHWKYLLWTINGFKAGYAPAVEPVHSQKLDNYTEK